MKKLATTILCTTLVTFTLSGQYLVSYDQMEDVDVTQYKTFQIEKVDVESFPEFKPREEGLSELLAAISGQMESRGYQQVESGGDLYLNLGVNITEEVQTRETDIRDAPRYMGQRNYHWESEEVVVREYTAGTVTLDLVDTKKNEMIWQSVAIGTLTPNPKKAKKRIQKAAKKLFQKYPVQAPK